MDEYRRQHIAIGHLSDSGDLKTKPKKRKKEKGNKDFFTFKFVG